MFWFCLLFLAIHAWKYILEINLDPPPNARNGRLVWNAWLSRGLVTVEDISKWRYQGRGWKRHYIIVQKHWTWQWYPLSRDLNSKFVSQTLKWAIRVAPSLSIIDSICMCGAAAVRIWLDDIYGNMIHSTFPLLATYYLQHVCVLCVYRFQSCKHLAS